VEREEGEEGKERGEKGMGWGFSLPCLLGGYTPLVGFLPNVFVLKV